MAISGTGTAADPYIPTTFADFRTCVGTSGAYVCLTQDIDVSKDSTYKTGTTTSLDILCRYIYGTARTYSSTTAYAVGNKCTYNDGEHGLCTYECIQACTGIDVSNTEYWTRGGNPTKKITGLIITYYRFFYCNSYNNQISISNLFFESCVFDKTNDSSAMFSSNSSSNNNIIFNDCSFSMFYNQHSYKPTITESMYIFNRCSLYIKFSHSISGNQSSEHGNTIGGSTSFNNCTIDIDGLCTSTTYSYNYAVSGLTNSSLHLVCDLAYYTGGNKFQIGGTNSFYAVTVRNVYGNAYSNVVFSGYFTGTNIIDKDVVGNMTFNVSSVQNLIAGTTEQCKDKDWLISQGFFTS